MVGVPEQFIGFDNYLALFGDKIYWKSHANTIIYTVDVSRRNWRWDFCWQLS
ncbi:MAG: hypothetical protein ACLTBV_30520 [Enterocloster bolteae]